MEDILCCLGCRGSAAWVLPWTFKNIVIMLLRWALLVGGFGTLMLHVSSTLLYVLGAALLFTFFDQTRRFYRTRLVCKRCGAPIADEKLAWSRYRRIPGLLNNIPCWRRIHVAIDTGIVAGLMPAKWLRKIRISHHQFLAASFENNDEARAVRHLEVLETLEGERGLIDLGSRCLDGIGVKEDHERAYQCFEKAAALNGKWLMYAEFNLGCMHMAGQFVPVNDVKAGQYFEKAANKGHPAAQYNWGLALIDGWAGYEDYAAGAEWLEKAAASGIPEAQDTLAMFENANHHTGSP
ncbi:tetratricopeptide repeat protein [Vreelandella sp. TE19]